MTDLWATSLISVPRRRFLVGAGALAALASCGRVSYQQPEVRLDPSFEQGAPARQDAVRSRTWWLSFQDENLNQLIQAGMVRNLDVRQAVAAITEARANSAAATAAGLPQINATGGAQRGDQIGAGTISQGTSLGGNVSWLADIFGENANAQSAADAQLQAAYFTVDVARLIMQAGIATAYVDMRYHQASIALTRRSMESRQRSLQLTQDQFDAGVVDRLAVVQAEQLVAEGDAQLPAFETGLDQSLARLATLTAQPIAALRGPLLRSAGQPRPRLSPSVGVPADVVRSRPDVAVAERTYAASVFNIGVAQAAFYPSVTLSGNIQATDQSGGTSIQTWALGPQLNLPIFDGGANQANLTRAESRAVQARLSWEQSILNAIEEVESGLAAYRRDARNVAAQQRLVESSEEAVDLSQQNFGVGVGAFFNVLDAERSALQAQQARSIALQQQSQNFIALSAATAGGIDGRAAR